jgi:hypothetical protein
MKIINSIDNGVTSTNGILFKIGGVAALMAAILCRRNYDAEYFLLRMVGIIREGPVVAPGTILEWFDILHNKKLLGFIFLNLSDLVNYVLVGMLFIALFVALKRVNVSLMLIAFFLNIIAVSVYTSSNQMFAMNSLSNQFLLATTAEQKSLLLAAGQATLAIHNNATFGSTGLYPSFLFISIAGLMISVVMLQSKTFSKVSGYFGLVANITGLGYYAFLLIAPAIVYIPLSVSAPFLLFWYILVGLRLLKLNPKDSREYDIATNL